MQVGFRQLPGGNGILKALIPAQVVPLALEADSRAPHALGSPPVHAGHAAGVVFSDCFGPEHPHAGTAGIGIPCQAAAAAGVPVPQMIAFHHDLIAAVALAQPSCAVPDVFSRGQHRQLAEPLAGQVQFFSRVAHGYTPLSERPALFP